MLRFAYQLFFSPFYFCHCIVQFVLLVFLAVNLATSYVAQCSAPVFELLLLTSGHLLRWSFVQNAEEGPPFIYQNITRNKKIIINILFKLKLH